MAVTRVTVSVAGGIATVFLLVRISVLARACSCRVLRQQVANLLGAVVWLFFPKGVGNFENQCWNQMAQERVKALKVISEIFVALNGIFCMQQFLYTASSGNLHVEVSPSLVNPILCDFWGVVTSQLSDVPRDWMLWITYYGFAVTSAACPFLFPSMVPQEVILMLRQSFALRLCGGLLWPDVRITCSAELVCFFLHLSTTGEWGIAETFPFFWLLMCSLAQLRAFVPCKYAITGCAAQILERSMIVRRCNVY